MTDCTPGTGWKSARKWAPRRNPSRRPAHSRVFRYKPTQSLAAAGEALRRDGSRKFDERRPPGGSWPGGPRDRPVLAARPLACLLYTSDAADDLLCVDL